MKAARRDVVHIARKDSLNPSLTINIIFPWFLSIRLTEIGTYRPDDQKCRIIAVWQLPGQPTPTSFVPVTAAPASLPGLRQPYKRPGEWFRG